MKLEKQLQHCLIFIDEDINLFEIINLLWVVKTANRKSENVVDFVNMKNEKLRSKLIGIFIQVYY